MSSLLFIIGLCLCFMMGINAISAQTRIMKTRTLFVFGDSLVDNGNNNFLYTSARADEPPYGIDLPEHQPTGRFSNGLNIPDIISLEMGSEPTLPYLDPELTGQKLLVGANFASAGIGILNDTGFQFVNVLRMPLQLKYFGDYIERVKSLVGGEKEGMKVIKQGVALVSLGGNDFVNNYFLYPFSARSVQFSLPQYVSYLIAEYRKILVKLYEMGVRRVIVMGPGPLGCAPAERALHSIRGECAADLQTAAALFEPQLSQMVKELNTQFRDAIFVAANTQRMHNNMITNPQAFGFESSNIACCGQGPYNGLGLCTTFSNLCKNRDKYVFWDGFHPTERASRLIVQLIMNGTNEYMKPMNLNTIMALDSQV